jgi:signal transduction histidine kinase
MVQRSRTFWAILFGAILTLLVILVAGWNLVLVRYHFQVKTLLERFSLGKITKLPESIGLADFPWIENVLGTLAFGVLLAGVILVFVKLFKEMKLNMVQTEFLEKVSHELKTPIATMELSANLLKEERVSLQKASSEEERLWRLHDEELKRLKDEVESLLEAARQQSQPIRAKLRSLDLDQWICDRWSFWQKDFPVEAELSYSNPVGEVWTRFDPQLLDFIFRNLFENARKYSGEKDTRVELRLEIKKRFFKGLVWRIRFKDRGIGFPKFMRKKIFKRFIRLNTSSKHRIPGNGLGLYLTRRFSRAMGLKIKAYSDGPHQGAEFILEGKLRKAPKAA